jgi:hypothetical protein
MWKFKMFPTVRFKHNTPFLHELLAGGVQRLGEKFLGILQPEVNNLHEDGTSRRMRDNFLDPPWIAQST